MARDTRNPLQRLDRSDDDDGKVMSGGAFGSLVFFGFVALLLVSVNFGVAGIENDLEARAHGLLQASGLSSVTVQASGTDLELSGNLIEGYDEEAVFNGISALHGVSSVTGNLWIITGTELDDIIVTGGPIEFSWDGSTVAITGDVSTEERKAFINDTLALTFSTVDDVGLAVLADIEDEKDWIGSVLSLLIATRESVDVGRLIVFPSDQLLVVAGEVADKAIRNQLNDRVEAVGEDLGFDVNPAIRVPETGPTEAEVEALQVEIDEVILDQVVEFETGSDVITEDGTALLDEMLAILRDAPDVRVEISGHADSQGSEAANLLLSQRRTEAVFAYFVANGESPDRFDVLWFGDTVPIADNSTEEGRQKNRRIEFRALLDEEQD
jgi:OOP family OmpA-OmpF porin